MCTLINEKFSIHPRRKYDYSSTKISRPLFLGDYSLDGNRKFFHDKRNLQYVNIDWKETKQVEYDLTIGVNRAIRSDPDKSKKEKLDNLLRWILLNLHKLQQQKDLINKKPDKNLLSVDFICFRGLLTTLLCTPYEDQDGWIICATKYCGTIYLCAYETPDKEAERNNRTKYQEEMCSWGYKFEQYMTSEESETTNPVNENVEYACIIRSSLGSKRLLYSPEVDAVDRKLYNGEPNDLSGFVEFKTSKLPRNDRENRTLHKFKFKKWWAQSYLAGIPRVVCGFREEGTVTSLKTYNVDSLPIRAQEYWQSRIMLNFMSEFLDYMKSIVTEDNPSVVYKFSRTSNSTEIKCVKYSKPSEWNFLPDWYIKDLR